MIITISAREGIAGGTFRKYYSAKRKWSKRGSIAEDALRDIALFFRSAKQKSKRDDLISSEKSDASWQRCFYNCNYLILVRDYVIAPVMHGRNE